MLGLSCKPALRTGVNSDVAPTHCSITIGYFSIDRGTHFARDMLGARSAMATMRSMHCRSFGDSCSTISRPAGREVRCGNARVSRARRKWTVTPGICCARVAYRDSEEGTLGEMGTLVEDLFTLNEAVKETNKGIGPDVRNRVDFLYNRATVLKSTMVVSDARVPAHLSATLKALHREHASVENIVRLAMEAGPLLTNVEARGGSDDEASWSREFKENLEHVEGSVLDSLTRESSQAHLTNLTDASSLSGFRREIERRVMEQLTGESVSSTMDSGVASEEQESGDAGLDGIRQIQNLPLPTRPESSGASNELDAHPHILLHQSSDERLTGTQQSRVETDAIAKELEELRSALALLEPQLSVTKEYSARAERAESKLQQLTEEMADTVPLDIHNRVVAMQRESLVRARTKITRMTAELKDKEVMLIAIKQETTIERECLLEKVRELSSELSKRISAEEVEASVRNAVHELEMELEKALARAESMRLELETNESLLQKLQQEWDAERDSLCRELADVKAQLAELAGDRTRFLEAVDKVSELEVSVSRMEQSMAEADEERFNKEKNVRLLVTEMTRSSEATEQNEETFLSMMKELIQQTTPNIRSREFDTDPSFHDLEDSGSIKLDAEVVTKPVITSYYESSWEFAYLHYSADNLGWSDLPGVCMRNDIVVDNVPLKVIDVEGSSIEFVLTDGRGPWDCAPSGGNYFIRSSGTFLLSSGCIEQKK